MTVCFGTRGTTVIFRTREELTLKEDHRSESKTTEGGPVNLLAGQGVDVWTEENSDTMKKSKHQ